MRSGGSSKRYLVLYAANAEAAYYVGMRAVVFHGDTAELRRELETVIVE